jgi:hypothetical protein
MSKRFTLWEAEKLIPQIRTRMREAVALKSEYDEAEEAAQVQARRIMMMGGSLVDGKSAREIKERRERASAQVRSLVESIQESGCVVKDLDTGLVDFPTVFRGREVYLCWKLDEASIGFWHGEEGFSGRKAIDQDFLDHHEGE